MGEWMRRAPRAVVAAVWLIAALLSAVGTAAHLSNLLRHGPRPYDWAPPWLSLCWASPCWWPARLRSSADAFPGSRRPGSAQPGKRPVERRAQRRSA
ncbi:hypothetical protein [Streptomyces lichenis]|uniref:DUF2637 domain-containing protein n=1 Tax=Streptomyces lichenis TaxID=2306967 RepID=A0ABT0IAD8_9ACTN|nr:hypothetical protein [Streptomyces lichenis]MCK8678291.1 hypothetical protein [Streptomyces lichenis]